MKHWTSPLHSPLISRHCPTGQELSSCADDVGKRLVTAAVGEIVGVAVITVPIGESDEPVVGVDVIDIVTGELDVVVDGFLVGEDVGVDDGGNVGDADGSLVGADVVGGGVGLVVSSSIDVVGGGEGLNVGSSPTEQTLDVHVNL